MYTGLFFLAFFVVAALVYKEFKLYQQSEVTRKERLAGVTASKDTLDDEELRSNELDTKAKAVVRRAKNNAFEKEINSLEDKEKK